jgi:DNA-binding NtrC family response regulator
MEYHPHLLIVGPSTAFTENLLSWVIPEGYRPAVATTFESANRQLTARPQIVVTQLRLHDYNGLHLALRARQAGIPAIVVGDADCVLERDAVQLGATFVRRDEFRREPFVTLLQNLAPATGGGVHDSDTIDPGTAII